MGSSNRAGGRVHFGASQGNRSAGELAEVPRFAVVADFVIAAGDALMVSHTSDGGAVVVTILSGDSREKAYAAGQMELNDVFDQVEKAYTPN